MKSVILGALAALNVLLVVILVNKFIPPNKAVAQAERPSDYLTVPAELNGVNTGVVFILDTSKGELSAMTYDENQNALLVFPKLNLTQVFKAGAGIGTGTKGPKPR